MTEALAFDGDALPAARLRMVRTIGAAVHGLKADPDRRAMPAVEDTDTATRYRLLHRLQKLTVQQGCSMGSG